MQEGMAIYTWAGFYTDNKEWHGNYESIFLKPSLSILRDDINVGLGLKVGTFKPNFVVYDSEEEDILNFASDLRNEGILLESSFTLGIDLSNRTTLNINSAFAHLEPLKNDYPYNISGGISFGFGLTYLIDTKSKKNFK